MANRIVEELIKKAKATSVINRGMYPVTVATNVYKQDGTPLERERDQEVPKADIIVNPEETAIVDILEQVNSGAIIEISEGEVTEELVLGKGVTIQGYNAGISQNYAQEI